MSAMEVIALVAEHVALRRTTGPPRHSQSDQYSSRTLSDRMQDVLLEQCCATVKSNYCSVTTVRH
jgi:hypothetical protein